MSGSPYEVELIANADLRQTHIPPRGADWSQVIRFARTFNGYTEVGFDACAELANHKRDCKTLSDFRACLFFEHRRHNHFGHDPDATKMDYIYDLLDRIRERVKTD
jgi:hypothetical protein